VFSGYNVFHDLHYFGQEMRVKDTPRHIFHALCSGLLLILSFPGAFGWWPLAWLALVPLLTAVRNVPPGRAFRLGLLTGFVHYTFLLYWIVIVLSTYGYLPWWVAVPALLLLSLYMSLYTAIFSLIISWFMQRGRGRVLWVAPLLWVALDYLRSLLFSGFPWQDLGYSQYRFAALLQTADLLGHYGITALLVLANCLFFVFITLPPRDGERREAAGCSRRAILLREVGPAAFIILAALVYGMVRSEQMAGRVAACPTFPVAVVQGNIPQDLKWTLPMQQRTVEIYRRLSEEALTARPNGKKPELLIWPETALPFYLQPAARLPQAVEDLVEKNGVSLLTGVPFMEQGGFGEEPEDRYYNSALLLAPDGLDDQRYNKQHLVPFGEYIPLRNYLPLPGPLVEGMGDFTSGSGQQPLACQSVRIGVLICFESIFPELARQWVKNGADLLVNLTNDAWYGRSSAPWQHFSMAVFRAVETRRSLARAANTGISGFIDPLGRVSGATNLFEPAYAAAAVPICREMTFFVRYGHFFPVICLLGVLVFFWYHVTRRC
jgi:apolipoprotein N-acyltransferase